MTTESTLDIRPAIRAGDRMLARVRTLLALRGVIGIVFAATLLIWPRIGLTAMVGAVGVFAVVSASVSAAAAFALPRAARRQRTWQVVHAVIGLVVAAAVLVWPDLSAVALLYALALWAIAVGVTELVAAFALPLSGPRRALVAVGGIALSAIGVVMFVDPGEGAIALLALVAACALVRGASDVALAVQLRKVARAVDQRLQPAARAEATVHA